MASIQKRGKKYAVVYAYEDDEQVKRQKWETFSTKKEALNRKAQIENEQPAKELSSIKMQKGLNI